jgi:hypothetical protein
MRKSAVVVAVVLATGACSATSSEDAQRLRAFAGDVRAENQAHLDAAGAIDTMPAMARETARHQAAMTTLDDGLGGAMNEMLFRCHGGGMSELPMCHAQLADEMTVHVMAMDDAPDVPAARAEVARHASAVTAVLDDLDVAIDDTHCER